MTARVCTVDGCDRPHDARVGRRRSIGQSGALDHRLAPIPDRPWISHAACLGVRPSVFFPERGDVAAVTKAKQICAGCPVRPDCLDTHLGERDGVWGGMSARERKALRAEREAT